MDPDRGSARDQFTAADPLMGDATHRHPIALAERSGGTRGTSPCCGRPCSGGPARVWCAGCGRTFQADELFATDDPRIRPAA